MASFRFRVKAHQCCGFSISVSVKDLVRVKVSFRAQNYFDISLRVRIPGNTDLELVLGLVSELVLGHTSNLASGLGLELGLKIV